MRAAILSLAALLLVTASAAGAEPASLYVEDLTWTELRDLIAAGTTTIIVPIGGTEQNGPHMAIGKHNIRVRLLAGKIAAGLGNAVVAPVLPYVPEGNLNPPSGHMRWPGTISVPEDSF
jgi:creatinine amidohydrolase/Fe(II)-dependent formamide hydrolase-like protein